MQVKEELLDWLAVACLALVSRQASAVLPADQLARVTGFKVRGAPAALSLSLYPGTRDESLPYPSRPTSGRT